MSLNAFSQSNTDEMLGAPKAKYYIQLWPDFSGSKFYYTLDNDYPSDKSKTLKDVTVGVPMRNKEVALTIRFYNPLRYSIKTSDSLLVDPSYQSIGEFATALTTLLGTLPNAAPLPDLTAGATTTTTTAGNASIIAAEQNPLTIYPAGTFDSLTIEKTNNAQAASTNIINLKEASSWAKQINGLRAEELAEWKFVSLQGNVKCVDTDSKILTYLKLLDKRYFDASIRGVMRQYLIKLSQPDNMSDFQAVNKRFKVVLDSLDKVNQDNIKYLQTFNELISGDITKDYLRAGATTEVNEYSCESFASYSQIVFKRFARARAQFQEKRNQMLDLGKKISKEVDELMTRVVQPANESQSSERSFILNRYNIQIEKMRNITITVQERMLNLNASPPSIEKTDKSFQGKIRLRAAQTFVPEFSVGGFYTNLTFPVYTIKDVNGEKRIGKSEEDYSVGAAGMLNLTLNALDGLAHPLLQLGVGTGKDRPTILVGAGLRLTWRLPIVVSGGPIWHWQQRLQGNYQENSLIDDEKTLKDNIVYRFVSKPSFYLGVQIGF